MRGNNKAHISDIHHFSPYKKGIVPRNPRENGCQLKSVDSRFLSNLVLWIKYFKKPAL
jgi:hypothetical protein